LYTCVTCNQEIPDGTEKKWGNVNFKCTPCMREYNNAKMARLRAKERGPDWQPKSTPRHAMLDCDGSQHRCTGCNKMKPINEFPNNKETPCGKDPRCKVCRHLARRERMGAEKHNPVALDEEERAERRLATIAKYKAANKEKLRADNKLFKLKANFNITSDQFVWLRHIQGDACFMCGEPEVRIDSRTGSVMNLAIDHDHRCCPERGKSCGKCVRHLLCSACNVMVGFAELKSKVVHRFADYIDLRPLDSYPGEGNW
jgi:hypothetical protein